MSYDIYGNPLQRGHCEVHPHVHEEYPCSVCLSEKRQHDRQQQMQEYCDGDPNRCKNSYYLGQAQEEMARLGAEIERLRAALQYALPYLQGEELDMARAAIAGATKGEASHG